MEHTAQEPTQEHEQQPANRDATRVLVTGATGYVGGRLVPRLLDAGYTVRVLVRGGRARLNGRPWRDAVEIAVGDVLQPDTLEPALADVDAAYYLIHSISGSAQFADRDKEAAHNFAAAAGAANVQQIIYLGGLGDDRAQLSEHLRSRQETGDALRRGTVPVTEFRAGMIVGSGSLSFEMLRHLAERLPMMLAPAWVFTRTQPIAIRDVLAYLLAALETPASRARIIEIGGADVVSYADMMQTYARLRGLRRFMIRVPVLTPGLSSHWVHWVTPIAARMARPLIEGLRNELLVRDTAARELFPQIVPLDFATAVELALGRLESGQIETVWSDALASSQGDVQPVHLAQEQGFLIERRELMVQASPARVYATFVGMGGARGWPPYHFLWVLRGILDRVVGGVGIRRGRRDPDTLREGEALDFWRVEAVKPDVSLVLRSEMKMPGRGWLQFEALPDTDRHDDGAADKVTTRLVQAAYFAPKGALGLLYWYGVYPLHAIVFSGMIRDIARRAEAVEAGVHAEA